MNKKSNTFISNLRYDFPASIVVFLVALPLCMGIALASNAPLFSGLLAGIVGGIVVGSLSGSQVGVSGPAAGLTVIVINAIAGLGTFESFLLAVLVAGVFQVILGLLKAGVIAYYFPSAVIKGMLSAIGLIIILKQLPHAVGYDGNPEGDFAFIQSDGENTFSELANMLNFISLGPVLCTLIALAILLFWESRFVQRIAFLKLIPGPLLAVISGILIYTFATPEGALGFGLNQLVQIPILEEGSSFTSIFTLPDFSQWQNPEIYITAITLAIVGSLETLLCVEATDKIDPQKRITPTNRELLAQGAGNMVSGLVGGLPVTQVIVRSSANIQAGARSKTSPVLHGFLLLICVLSIPSLLNKIPLATLAAILLVVGYKLASPKVLFSMFRKGRSQYVPYLVTVLGIVFTDLLIGIAIGMGVGIIQILWNNFRTPYHLDPEALEPGKPIVIRFSEDVSFLNKASILHTLNELPEGIDLVLDLSSTRTMHPDVEEIISDFEKTTERKNIRLTILRDPARANYNPMELFQERILQMK